MVYYKKRRRRKYIKKRVQFKSGVKYIYSDGSSKFYPRKSKSRSSYGRRRRRYVKGRRKNYRKTSNASGIKDTWWARTGEFGRRRSRRIGLGEGIARAAKTYGPYVGAFLGGPVGAAAGKTLGDIAYNEYAKFSAGDFSTGPSSFYEASHHLDTLRYSSNL